jgi:hypothetical protein
MGATIALAATTVVHNSTLQSGCPSLLPSSCAFSPRLIVWLPTPQEPPSLLGTTWSQPSPSSRLLPSRGSPLVVTLVPLTTPPLPRASPQPWTLCALSRIHCCPSRTRPRPPPTLSMASTAIAAMAQAAVADTAATSALEAPRWAVVPLHQPPTEAAAPLHDRPSTASAWVEFHSDCCITPFLEHLRLMGGTVHVNLL